MSGRLHISREGLLSPVGGRARESVETEIAAALAGGPAKADAIRLPVMRSVAVQAIGDRLATNGMLVSLPARRQLKTRGTLLWGLALFTFVSLAFLDVALPFFPGLLAIAPQAIVAYLMSQRRSLWRTAAGDHHLREIRMRAAGTSHPVALGPYWA